MTDEQRIKKINELKAQIAELKAGVEKNVN